MKNIILFLVLLCAISCNSVKKASNVQKSSFDSTSMKASDSIAVSKIHESVKKSGSNDYEKTTVYDYDKDVNIVGHDTIIKYIPRIVTVYEKGHAATQESTSKIIYDSTAIKKDDSTLVRKSQEIVTKTKVSSRFPWPLAVILVVIVALIAFYLYAKKW